MIWPRPLAASVGRAAALGVTAVTLLATSSVPCRDAGAASFAAATSCGPPGVIALSFAELDRGGCGDGCRAFLEAPGANAVGLPEQGEIVTGDRDAFDEGDFALVGPAPVAGAVPAATVDRVCTFTPAGPGVLEVACSGDAAEARCGGTLTRVAAAGDGT